MKTVNLEFIAVREGLHTINELYFYNKLTEEKFVTKCDCQVMVIGGKETNNIQSMNQVVSNLNI